MELRKYLENQLSNALDLITELENNGSISPFDGALIINTLLEVDGVEYGKDNIKIVDRLSDRYVTV